VAEEGYGDNYLALAWYYKNVRKMPSINLVINGILSEAKKQLE
jgi:hypothetical protein